MKPIGQFDASGRTRFVVAVDDEHVVVVDPDRYTSNRFDRAQWLRTNRGDLAPLDDFVGAASALAQARAALLQRLDTANVIAVGTAESLSFTESLALAASLEDGWDDRFVRSLAPSAAGIEKAREFVERNVLPDPEVDVHVCGSLTLTFANTFGEVQFTIDREGALTCLVEHDQTVLALEDLSTEWLTELGLGLVRATATTDAPIREFILVAVIEEGRGTAFLIDLAARTVDAALADGPSGNAQAILANHIDDVGSIAAPRTRRPGRTDTLTVRTEDGLLESRPTDADIELVDVQLVVLPQLSKRKVANAS